MFMANLPEMETSLLALSREFAEHAAEHDAANSFPFENIKRLHAEGLLALVIPKAEGGRGGGLTEAEHAVNVIAKGDPSTALVLAQNYLFQHQMVANSAWPRSLRDRITASMVGTGALANVLRVEPELGTPARGGLPATLARRVEGGYRISGHKIYSTGAPGLSWLGVWARSDDEHPLTGLWLVPSDVPGISIKASWDHLGMRASCSHDVVFDDVFVAQDHAVDIRPAEEWGPFSAADGSWYMTLFTTIYDGVARAARDWFVEFLQTRVPSNLGAALATLPRMQEALGTIESLLYVNRVLLDDVVQRSDKGAPPPSRDSQFMKLTVTNNAIAAVAKALEHSGNPGLSRHNPLQRHYRDVLCGRVHTPQSDVILTSAGREVLAETQLNI
jgi:alkylation response protein AidB-like acyl-CoA dehydrogenase